MDNKKIHLPARRMRVNEQGCIKLTKEAMAALVDLVNETNLSLRTAASEIILQAINNDLISLDREENEGED